MNETILDIYHAFHGKLIGTDKMKNYVCLTLSKMSEDIVLAITENCWFVGSFDDAWAYTFTGNDFRNKNVIFLSDSLLHQNEQQIQYSIAHEVGHVILGHRNAVWKKQTEEEIALQEQEADQFAKKFGFSSPQDH